MMGGDLVSDGLASFWDESDRFIIKLPKLRDQLLEFLKTHKNALASMNSQIYEKIIEFIRSGYADEVSWNGGFASSPLVGADMLFSNREEVHLEFHRVWNQLEDEARKSPEFLDYIMKNHILKFYEALKYSGRSCDAVFVVMGDHDLDFPQAYSTSQINSINNVFEISGRKVLFQNLNILGLGYLETHYLEKMRSIIALYQGNIDIILTHAEQRRMQLLASIKPGLILRGHFMQGIYQVNNTQVASAIFPSYIIVKMENNKVVNIEYIEP